MFNLNYLKEGEEFVQLNSPVSYFPDESISDLITENQFTGSRRQCKSVEPKGSKPGPWRC